MVLLPEHVPFRGLAQVSSEERNKNRTMHEVSNTGFSMAFVHHATTYESPAMLQKIGLMPGPYTLKAGQEKGKRELDHTQSV